MKIENDYHFEYQEDFLAEDEQILFDGLNEEAVLKKKMNPIKPWGIFIKSSKGNILGGAKGVSFYGCLYIDMLWIKEEKNRSLGLGRKIMAQAETVGRERHCTFATVNTMDWEAFEFYQKLGYDIEFIREGYENNSRMYLLRKNL